jgi:hypothetical protein
VITDRTLIRIGEAVQLSHQGERQAVRLRFAQIWEEIGGEQGDPLHVCTLAHAMADVQDDVRQELVWDQRALAAADLLTDAPDGAGGSDASGRRLVPVVAPELERVLSQAGRCRPCS